MHEVSNESVHLIVTSPPYPMIEMWDEDFASADPAVSVALRECDGATAFTLMHQQLNAVWAECARVVRPGGFLCINIGDATRKVGNNFRLYTNHARITNMCESLGFQSLPAIIWRKQANAPNKFMGSGMLPSGAYVTLEHEYILIFRKEDKREFTGSEAEHRRSSAFFWEERNKWFSDLWEFKGTRQGMENNAARARSAAFPFELAYRLINMYSLQSDTVLDPFLGTGTTMAACLASARNSIGYESLESLSSVIADTIKSVALKANALLAERIKAHLCFVEDWQSRHGIPLGYISEVYGFPVMTRQEVQIQFYELDRVHQSDVGEFSGFHSPACIETCSSTVLQFSKPQVGMEDQLAFSLGS